MQGKTIPLGSSNVVAVDTGTTLIGGPAAIIASIYASIPGSQPMTEGYTNYYQYPCTTNIDFQITIGGYTIKITNQDFSLGHYSSDSSMCTGAAFIQDLPSNAPIQWIVGDTALKNVYSVYRYKPPAVGFADLAADVTNSESSKTTTIPDVSTLSDAALTTGTANGTLSTSSTSLATNTSRTSTSARTSSSALPSVVTATSTIVPSTPTELATSQAPSTSASSSASRTAAISVLVIVTLVVATLIL